MSTLPNISSAAVTDVLPGKQGATHLPMAAGDIAGLFEEMMAQALSPSTGKGTAPNGKAPSPVKTGADAVEIIAQNSPEQLISIEVNPKTSSKTQSKPAHGNTHTNNNSTTQTDVPNPVVTPEITVNQILAAAVAMANTPGKLNTEVAQASSQIKTSANPPVLPITLPTAKQTFAALTKTSAVAVSENQNLPTSEPSTAETASSLTTRAVEPVAASQPKPISTIISRISSPDRISNQTASALESANLEKLSPSVVKATADQPHHPSISMPVETATAASSNGKFSVQPQNSSSKEADSDVKASESAPSDSNGTSVAKQDMSMKQADNTNKIAGQNEKVLPSGGISIAKASSAATFAANNESSTISAANISAPGSASSAPAADAVADSSITDARTNILERTQEMVSLNTVRLSDSGNNSLQVVIKPDAGTQLSLELRQQNGQVQVQAMLQQGNFNQLSQQWPDLQQRLEQRGIQLAPLTDNASLANGNNSETFQNKQNQTTEAGQEITFTNTPASMLVPEIKPASTYQGWETWA